MSIAPRTASILLLLMALWGLNFAVIKIALVELPPVLLAALRFFLVAFPAALIVGRPHGNWPAVAAYGMLMFALQFGCLFAAMRWGVASGLAAVLLQAQVLLTIAFGALFLAELPTRRQFVGVLMATAGIAWLLHGSANAASWSALTLGMLAAGCWAGANTLTRRRLRGQSAPALAVWGSLFSVLPLWIASMVLEGDLSWQLETIRGMSLSTWLSVLYIAYVSTLFGFAVWAWAIRSHQLATIAPFTLLVPLFGLFFGFVIHDEQLSSDTVWSVVAVLSGLALVVTPLRSRASSS